MKKILILISGLYMGGFSKSLINFLWCMNQEHPDYKITLAILNRELGTLEEQLPIEVDRLHIVPQIEEDESCFSSLIFYKIKYLVNEIFYKYVKHEEIPVSVVREFAQAKLSYKAKHVLNDFDKLKEFEVVISWEEEFCNYIMINKFPNRYKIGYIHPNYLEAGFSKKIDEKYLCKLDRVVTVSESCASTLKRVFPEYKEKIVCIPNRLNLNLYSKLAKEYVPNYDEKCINLLTVARVVDYSRAVFRMVNLVERLRRDGFYFKWYLIGDGQDYERLQKQIKEKGLEEYLICLGEMDNPCPYMKYADVYVQQSYYEGRPVSVDEAMMLGTPALVTNYSSAKEQVVDEITGWIVDNNEDSIYEKLKELLGNPHMINQAHQWLEKEDNKKFESCDAIISMLETLEF